ncbi:MAG: ABC transporter permease [Caldilineaceae bacterium]
MPATRKLATFLKPYWHWATLAPLLMVVEVAMDLLQPRFIEHIIDQGIAQSNLSVVLNTGLWMVGVAVIGLIGGVGCGVFTVLASQNFGADLRQTLFAKVQALSFGNLDTLETGGLITRLTNDVTQITEMVSMLLRVMVRVPLLMVGSLIMGYLTSPRLSLLFLVLIPVVAIVLARVINRAYPLFGGVQQRLDRLNTVMQENLGRRTRVKSLCAHQARAGPFPARQRRPDRPQHPRRAHGGGDHAADDAGAQHRYCHRALGWRRQHQQWRHAGGAGGSFYQLFDAGAHGADDDQHVDHALLAPKPRRCALARCWPVRPKFRIGRRRAPTLRRAGRFNSMASLFTTTATTAIRCSKRSAFAPSRVKPWRCWAPPAPVSPA